MKILLSTALAAFTLTSCIYCADVTVAWCYHLPSCNDAKWPELSPKYCNGSRQSPINIKTSAAKADSTLTEFTFTKYNDKSLLKEIVNTGKTIKVNFNSGAKVSGGGLPEEYESLQFHLHWGNGSSVPGSEHTVDGKRYPMALHIVSQKSSANLTEALNDSKGFAALGFFIEEKSGDATDEPASWNTFTSYLKNIPNKDDKINMAPGISLDDLLTGVDRTKYYRYLGSFTTPTCNEVVVWTVFKESIKVSKALIDLFSTMVHVNGSSSPLMTNVYRSIQVDQPVTTQSSSSSVPSASIALVIMALSLVVGKI
ncbi:carbonic anhydrase 4-like [Cynoglossus semilaevis]|uniref:carbonic anhydrase 4-like n=1 Tax=Cynoglossus semilaevis TaxID=244447 RepID=UPI000497BC2F|nr:carbonic anhydrase 4-like [Cynoglossus semilaevis]